MTLIKCTECNKQFSEYTNACPNCACPIEIVNKNILIKKEEQYNKAINIIATYKTKKELYLAKQILTSLDNYKDSANKIKEINNLLKYEHECQVIKIKQFFNKKRMITILNFIIIILCIFKLMDGKLTDELIDERKEYYKNKIHSLATQEIDKLKNTLKESGYTEYVETVTTSPGTFRINQPNLIKEIENKTYYFMYADTISTMSLKYYSSQLDELANNISVLYEDTNYKCESKSYIEYDIIENKGYFSCFLIKHKSTDNNGYISYSLPLVCKKNYNDDTFLCHINIYHQELLEPLVDIENAVAINHEIEKIKDEFNNYIKESNVNIDIIKEYKNIN